MSGKVHVNHTWIIDSGASHHTTHLPFILQSIKKLEKPFQIITPIRTSTLVETWEMLSNNLMLHNVLLVPSFNCNLISIHKLTCNIHYCVTYDELVA